MSFRDRLKEARLSKGFKQTELSQKIGLSKNAVSNYENGSSNPNIDVLYKLLEILEIEPNFLFQDEIPTKDINLSNADKDLFKRYKKLNKVGQKKTSEYINLLLLNQSVTKRPPSDTRDTYEMVAYDVDEAPPEEWRAPNIETTADD